MIEVVQLRRKTSTDFSHSFVFSARDYRGFALSVFCMWNSMLLTMLASQNFGFKFTNVYPTIQIPINNFIYLISTISVFCCNRGENLGTHHDRVSVK